jgi:8-oxo-dGTP pyrophosphatase MutT (NUDIX family)
MPSTPKYNDFFAEGESEGNKYWGDTAAGCIFVAKDTGRILLAQRGIEAEEPGTWGTWGGKIDGDESPQEAVKREVEEETGYDGITKITPLYVYRDGTFKYHNFLVIVPFEFTPQLNWENENSAWVEYGKWPEPIHFGLTTLLNHAGHKIKHVIDLLAKKRNTFTESVEDNKITVAPQGIVNVGTYGYKWITPHGYLWFTHSPNERLFTLLMIRTEPEFQGQGHSKQLLEKFFQHIKQNRGALEVESYTTAGMAHVQHVIERLAKQYHVRLV